MRVITVVPELVHGGSSRVVIRIEIRGAVVAETAGSGGGHGPPGAATGGRPLVLPAGLEAAPGRSSPKAHGVRGHADVLVFVLLGFFPLVPEPIVVLDEVDHVSHFVADVDALVFTWKTEEKGNNYFLRKLEFLRRSNFFLKKSLELPNIYIIYSPCKKIGNVKRRLLKAGSSGNH